MIRLDLMNVGIVEETGDVLLVLRSPEQARLLVIETGVLEGGAIAMEVQGIRSERPLTQDLLHEVIVRLGARVREIRIKEFHDETFYATIVLVRPDGGVGTVEVDARPSDAIALALRARASIYADEEVMARVGVDEDRNGRLADLFGPDDEEDEDEERILH